MFDLEHVTKLSGHEDRMTKCNTSSIVRNHHIPHGEMDLSLKRELHGIPRGIPLLNCLDSSFSFLTSRHPSSFSSVPPPLL
jgi:hypothetical protein